MKVLVTGASGFVGSKLCPRLASGRHEVVACSRSRVEQPGIFYVASPQLGRAADWSQALTGIDAMVHLAGLAAVDGRVHFLGFVPDKLLPVYYQASHVFCLPSVTQAEAFGIVQVEAMASGKPVVSTRLNNGVDFVNEHGKTGLTVQPGDPTALAGALSDLLDDEERARSLGANGRAKAQAEYSADKMAERILGIYRAAIARP